MTTRKRRTGTAENHKQEAALEPERTLTNATRHLEYLTLAHSLEPTATSPHLESVPNVSSHPEHKMKAHTHHSSR